MRREIEAFRHAWQRRVSHAIAIVGAGAGLVLVGYAVRRYRAGVGREVGDGLGVVDADAADHCHSAFPIREELPLTGPAA